MEQKISSGKIYSEFLEEAKEELNNEQVEKWVKVFEKYFDGNTLLTYTDITEYIYTNANEDVLDIIKENWARLMEYQNRWDLEPERNLQEKFKKVEDHIQLAITQRYFILNNIKSLQEELNEKSQELESLEGKISDARETLVNLKDIKTRIYTEFVTILGIFTAIVVGAFGSLQVIGSVFSNISNVSTGKLIVFTSLTSIGVSVLLFLLMRWINKIVYLDYDEKKEWNISLKENSFFFLVNAVLVYLMILGFMLYADEPKNTILTILSYKYTSIFILGAITVIFIFVSRYLWKKQIHGIKVSK